MLIDCICLNVSHLTTIIELEYKYLTLFPKHCDWFNFNTSGNTIKNLAEGARTALTALLSALLLYELDTNVRVWALFFENSVAEPPGSSQLNKEGKQILWNYYLVANYEKSFGLQDWTAIS